VATLAFDSDTTPDVMKTILYDTIDPWRNEEIMTARIHKLRLRTEDYALHCEHVNRVLGHLEVLAQLEGTFHVRLQVLSLCNPSTCPATTTASF
jgi:hypothetical protein